MISKWELYQRGVKMSSALVLENISFSYEQNEIFSDLNYTFNTGNIYSIMGSNGEGKQHY